MYKVQLSSATMALLRYLKAIGISFGDIIILLEVMTQHTIKMHTQYNSSLMAGSGRAMF